MLAQKTLVNEVMDVAQPDLKYKVIGRRRHVQNGSCPPSNNTTMHRFLLSRTLAVNTHIDWYSSEIEQTARSAFFRSLAGRLIDVH